METSKTVSIADTAAAERVSAFISPRELMFRWQCSRTQVDRIARRENLKRLVLGVGRNGMVRYVRAEVESLESGRLV